LKTVSHQRLRFRTIFSSYRNLVNYWLSIFVLNLTVEKSMADLWDSLEETKSVESPTRVVDIKAPDTIVVQDLINHDKIRSETEQLRMSLECSARIVVAAYKVADYVPDLNNTQQREFWQVQVSLILLSLKKSTIQYFKTFIGQKRELDYSSIFSQSNSVRVL
jgi:hypothetical protein